MGESYRIWLSAVFTDNVVTEHESKGQCSFNWRFRQHKSSLCAVLLNPPAPREGKVFHVFSQLSPFMVAGARIAPSRSPFAVLVVIDVPYGAPFVANRHNPKPEPKPKPSRAPSLGLCPIAPISQVRAYARIQQR